MSLQIPTVDVNFDHQMMKHVFGMPCEVLDRPQHRGGRARSHARRAGEGQTRDASRALSVGASPAARRRRQRTDREHQCQELMGHGKEIVAETSEDAPTKFEFEMAPTVNISTENGAAPAEEPMEDLASSFVSGLIVDVVTEEEDERTHDIEVDDDEVEDMETMGEPHQLIEQEESALRNNVLQALVEGARTGLLRASLGKIAQERQAERPVQSPQEPREEIDSDLKSSVLQVLLEGSRTGRLQKALDKVTEEREAKESDHTLKAHLGQAMLQGAQSGNLQAALSKLTEMRGAKEKQEQEATPSTSDAELEEDWDEVMSLASDDSNDPEEAIEYVNLAFKIACRAVQIGLESELENDEDEESPLDLATVALPAEFLAAEEPPSSALPEAPSRAMTEQASPPPQSTFRALPMAPAPQPTTPELPVQPCRASEHAPLEAPEPSLPPALGAEAPATAPAAAVVRKSKSRAPRPTLSCSSSSPNLRLTGSIARKGTEQEAKSPTKSKKSKKHEKELPTPKSPAKLGELKVRCHSPAGALRPRFKESLTTFRLDEDSEVEDSHTGGFKRSTSITNMYEALGTADFHSMEDKTGDALTATLGPLPHPRSLGPLIVNASPKSSSMNRSSSTSAMALDLGMGDGATGDLRRSPTLVHSKPSWGQPTRSTSLGSLSKKPAGGLLPQLQATRSSRPMDWSLGGPKSQKGTRMWAPNAVAPIF